MSDPERLAEYIDIWWEAIGDFTALVEGIDEADAGWATDLPGWSVHDVVAHVAHLEHLAAGGRHDDVEGIDVGEPGHVGSPMSVFTEQGVVARRDTPVVELLADIRHSVAARREHLESLMPIDPEAPADGMFGAIGWSWRTLLRNRPLDVWMHEQDVRRALGQPGGEDRRAARHSVAYLSEALPVVLAKRAGATPGSSAVLEVEGHPPTAAVVNDDGRGALVEPPDDPTVRLRLSQESFIVLAGGRRQPADDAVAIEGDAELGRRLLDAFAITP